MVNGPLGDFEVLVLLAVLRVGDRANGSAVRADIEATTSRRIARGAVYVTLDRLEDKGLLASRLGPRPSTRGGPPTRFYRVSTAGRRAVAQSVSDILRMHAGLRANLPLVDPS
jgi:PadR family transcriptional regulator PadR